MRPNRLRVRLGDVDALYNRPPPALQVLDFRWRHEGCLGVAYNPNAGTTNMTRLTTLIRTAVCAATIAVAGSASAVTVSWTDWTSFATDAKSAAGTMGGVGVSVSSAVAMNGVTQLGCGTNYWTEPNASSKPYTGGTVSNAPTACEQLGLNSAQSRITVTFSSAVSTLYMALLSVGQAGVPVTYDFDQAFVIDSEGQGYFGNDATNGVLGAGDSLTMREFHGLLRFNAPVSSLSFSTDAPENWHAFTFGSAQAAAVPEPASVALAGLALLAAGAATRRRRV